MQSRLLRINSRFKQPNETNTAFSFIYTGVNISSIQLLKFSCMRLLPNVYSPYDTLDADGVLHTIPTGQYTALELAAYINTLGIDCSLTVNNKFQFTGFANEIRPTRLSNLVLGFPDFDILTPIVSQNTPTLQSPDPIYIESNDLALSNCLDSEDSNGGNIPLVWSIPNQVPYGFQIAYESADSTINQIDVKSSTISNRRLNFKITDQFGHGLVLPDNQFCDLIFKIFYNAND